MKFNISNENAEYLAYFEEYDAVGWIENSKIHKYQSERFEFSLGQILNAFYLKFKGNEAYQYNLKVSIVKKDLY